MKSNIITTSAVTQERTVMVPKVETVVVTPETQEVALTLTAKEAEHLLNIFGARGTHDSRLGATGDENFEYRLYNALKRFIETADPGALNDRVYSSPAAARERKRNAAFRVVEG